MRLVRAFALFAVFALAAMVARPLLACSMGETAEAMEPGGAHAHHASLPVDASSDTPADAPGGTAPASGDECPGLAGCAAAALPVVSSAPSAEHAVPTAPAAQPDSHLASTPSAPEPPPPRR